MQRLGWVAAFGLCTALAACAPQNEGAGSILLAAEKQQSNSPANIHKRLMVLDSHLDTPAYFHDPSYDFGARGSWDEDGTSVDLPRMKAGGLDGGFWVIYIPQGPLTETAYAAARNAALMRQSAIRELVAKYEDDLAMAYTAREAESIFEEGKRVVLQSMENAYPLGEDLSLLETFYIGGVRMISPVHSRNNQFADSASDVREVYGGLSPLGEDFVREANRLGMIIDASHASDETLRDIIALSQTPPILSHSGPDGIFESPRNVSDDLIIALAEAGGVIQVNALGIYLEDLPSPPGRSEAIAAMRDELSEAYGSILNVPSDVMREGWRDISRRFPRPRSSFEKYMEHVLYVLALVGPDHVGIGADWDGGGGVDGMADVTALPRVTEALLAAGYTEADLEKIWGGNMMRLLREAEAARTATTTSPQIVN